MSTRTTNNPAMSLVAGTALAVNLLATLNASTGVADLCSASLIPLGQTMQTVLVTENQSIRLLSAGTLELTADGVVTKGAPVYTAANGKISATAADGARCVGIALDAAAADGDIIGVLPSALAAALVVQDLAALTATPALTVSTGGAASSTLAAAVNTDALTDNSGGAAADQTIGVVTLPTLAGWNGSTDPTAAEATQIIVAVTACRDAIKELTTELAKQRTLNAVLVDSITSIGTEYNKLRADFVDLRASAVSSGLFLT